jgi:hypothetical protein
LLPDASYSRGGVDEYSVHVKKQSAAINFQHRLHDKCEVPNTRRSYTESGKDFL